MALLEKTAMPCYEPPPLSDAPEFRASERQAVQLLCELVGAQIKSDRPMPPKFIRWYVRHKELDAKLADMRDQLDPGEAAHSIEASQCRADAAAARRLLVAEMGS